MAVTIRGSDSSAATPALTGTDTNTGVFFPTTNNMALSTGGTERMRITSAGDVGIGQPTPTANLHIRNTGGNATLKLEFGAGGTQSNIIGAASEMSLQVAGASAMTFYTNSSERMRIDTSGNLLVGATSGTSKIVSFKNSQTAYNTAAVELQSQSGDVVLGFHAVGATARCLDHVRGGSSIRAVNSTRGAFIPLEASAFTVGSDYRLKENIVPLVGALDRVASLPVHRFNFKSAEEVGMCYGDKTVDGFLAHEVAEVVPEAAFGEKDAVKEDGTPNYQSIDQSKLVPVLWAAIQELKATVDAQAARIAALEAKA